MLKLATSSFLINIFSMESRDILENVFPTDQLVDDEDLQRRLVIPDYTNGEVSKYLEQLSPEELNALQRMVTAGIQAPVPHIEYLQGLVQGYHGTDRRRRSKSAQEMVLRELELSNVYCELTLDSDYLPIVCGFAGSDEKGWYMLSSEVAHPQSVLLQAVIDDLREFVQDPEYTRSLEIVFVESEED